MKLIISTSLLAMLCLVPASAATLTAGLTVMPNSGFFDYSYMFSIAGAGGIDNIFLGSDDLSPLNLRILLNGGRTPDWSWLGNDVPVNYLQFFSISSTTLGPRDLLEVQFTSSFAPGSMQFAQGFGSTSGAVTNRVIFVGPSAVPEPATFWMLLAPVLIVGAVWRIRNHQNFV